MVDNDYYHVITRTVGDTIVFKNEADFYRGIFSIYEFNNDNPVNIWERRKERSTEKKKRGPTSLFKFTAFSLMDYGNSYIKEKLLRIFAGLK